MKKIFFTPGPAHLYPKVPEYIAQALDLQLLSRTHRSKFYESYHQKAVEGVRALMAIPQDFHIFFHSSATEIWERLIQNVVVEKSFHFVNGSFSKRYFEIATDLQVDAQKAEVAWGEAFDFSQVKIDADTELINFTHNETSTGVMLDLEEVYRWKDSHPDALLTLDMVSSAPYAQPDWSKIDAGYFSVQKCFGLPAGLGVLILSPKMIAKAEQKLAAGHSIGSYHSFPSLLSKAQISQTPETPNMLNIYLLGQVCEDMLRQGIDTIRQETEQKAAMLYDFFEAHEGYQIFVKNAKYRSQTVIVIDVAAGSGPLLKRLAEQGFAVGSGYGKMKPGQIRVANFPAVSVEDVGALIEGIRK
jgi:phosphoserine aminotransferase